ncbi:hypothetical protein LINPERHAP1_LOCUS41076, partial [Linum perenne]
TRPITNPRYSTKVIYQRRPDSITFLGVTLAPSDSTDPINTT